MRIWLQRTCVPPFHTPPATDGGMSSDSEDEIYANTHSTSATGAAREGVREAEKGGDDPLYHSDYDNDTPTENSLGTSRTSTHSTVGGEGAIPHSLHIPNNVSSLSNTLLVRAPERGRASSLRDERHSEGEGGGGGGDEMGPIQRSRSQEMVSRGRGRDKIKDKCGTQSTRIHDKQSNISIKTQIQCRYIYSCICMYL